MLWRWSTRCKAKYDAYACNLSSPKAEAGGLPWVWGQPILGLHLKGKKVRSKRFIMWKIICKTDFYFLIKCPVQLKQEIIYYSKYFNGKGSVNLPNESQNYFSLNQIIEHTSFFTLVVLFFNMLIHVYDINSNKCLTFMVRIPKV